jgi:hypothetical protein
MSLWLIEVGIALVALLLAALYTRLLSSLSLPLLIDLRDLGI